MNTNPSHAAPVSSGRRYATLVILCFATLLLAIDMTVLHLAVPAISADLQPTSTEMLWIIDVYGFMVAGSLAGVLCLPMIRKAPSSAAA